MICEVCLEDLNGPTLDLGDFPLCDDLLPIGTDSYSPAYRQSIILCQVCLTAHQLFPVVRNELFKPSYHYRSALTNDVLLGMRNLVESTLEKVTPLKQMKVLDIGCNDGSLLEIFSQLSDCITVGVDPTNAIDDAETKVNYCYKAFFDVEQAKVLKAKFGTFDVITFTNVFAHIEDLPALIESLKLLIGEETTLVIENHYLGSILDSNQFDTFYHEHPRTYSFESFKVIAKSLDMNIADAALTKRYGGNIRVTFHGKKSSDNSSFDEFFESEKAFLLKFSELQGIYQNWKVNARETLNGILRGGPILGKSLPGRAVMLINALNISEVEMPFVSEKTASPKVGHYVPGTKIMITSDEHIDFSKESRLVIWAWHISDEIVGYLDVIGYTGEVWIPLPVFKRIR